ncbi:MAG: hypothetical protein ACMG6S_16285 [Byssovorax sp.]
MPARIRDTGTSGRDQRQHRRKQRRSPTTSIRRGRRGGVPASKYLDGIGTQRMAIADADEDPVTLAVSAARRAFALSGRDPGETGLCVVGTETAIDHSKPIAAFLHGLLGLPLACRVFETKHACFGGTAGLFNALDWIASGSARGRSALVICADVARYALGSAGEPTQGAGSVAMIVSAALPRRARRRLRRVDGLLDGYTNLLIARAMRALQGVLRARNPAPPMLTLAAILLKE